MIPAARASPSTLIMVRNLSLWKQRFLLNAPSLIKVRNWKFTGKVSNLTVFDSTEEEGRGYLQDPVDGHNQCDVIRRQAHRSQHYYHGNQTSLRNPRCTDASSRSCDAVRRFRQKQSGFYLRAELTASTGQTLNCIQFNFIDRGSVTVDTEPRPRRSQSGRKQHTLVDWLPDGDQLTKVQLVVVDLSDEDGRHGLVERRAVHVDGGTHGQDEAGDLPFHVAVLQQTLHGDGQRGRAGERTRGQRSWTWPQRWSRTVPDADLDEVARAMTIACNSPRM